VVISANQPPSVLLLAINCNPSLEHLQSGVI
jgi:hypothetical protein